ncbi:MAG: family 20 glycosylhydrolase, partial [Gemmatimonadota bacterium]
GEGGVEVPAGLPGAEGYLLEVSAAGVSAVGRDARGARYALATLLQLSQRRGRDVILHGARVRDWPYKPVRMVHLYLPGPDHLPYARRYLRDFLVRAKYNGLFLEIGGGVRFRGLPEVPVAWRRFAAEYTALGDTVPVYGEHTPLGPGGRFQASVHTHLADGRCLEPDDLARLCDWARDLDLDVVPEVQSLSHAYWLALAYPEIAELPEAAFPDSYCPCNPRSYELLFRGLEEVIDLTGCRSVHMGHDEWRTGSLCPRCREHDSGRLFGQDVVRIASWLRERGQGAWMWADHLIPGHNGRARSHKGRQVWYDYPDTQAAAALIRAGAPDITLLNWSLHLPRQEADDVLGALGFRWIYGNLRDLPDWAGRSDRPEVLGGEVSSWCAWEDFELGMTHYPQAAHCANLLWSRHWPAAPESRRRAALQLPPLRDRMRRSWDAPRLWSQAVLPERLRPLSIAAACNAPLVGDTWDLSGLRPGPAGYAGVPYELVDPVANGGRAAVVVARPHRDVDEYPSDAAPIPVGGRWAGLIFWQVASEKGGHPMHAGDGTHFPHEAAELLGWYEILYADGLTDAAEVRYGQNVRAWDEGCGPLYDAREVPVGTGPDGGPLVLWGLEWTNPRPNVEIVSAQLRGARGLPEIRPRDQVSTARPMLLGITGVEAPRWADYRPGVGDRLPGAE